MLLRQLASRSSSVLPAAARGRVALFGRPQLRTLCAKAGDGGAKGEDAGAVLAEPLKNAKGEVSMRTCSELPTARD